jgi:DNA-binding protein H-NS
MTTQKKLSQLESKIAKLQAQKTKLINEQSIPTIIAQMRTAGITPQQIAAAWAAPSSGTAKRGARVAKVKTPKPDREPKYKNPETGDTWSGMGRPPFWLRDLETAGRSRDEFLIVQ